VTGATRLRVAVFAAGGHAADWPALLAMANADLVHVESLEALAGAPVDLAVAFASREESQAVLAAFAGRPGSPPLTLLSGDARGRHPQARLMEALISGKQEWEGIFDAIEDPLAIVGCDGVVVRANAGFARMLGRPFPEVVRRSYLEMLGEPDPALGDPIADSIADGAPRTREASFAGLPQRRVLVTTGVRRKEGGGARTVVFILKDLTALEDRQARTMQAHHLAAIGRLAGGVAHEINTPLTAIALRTERLLKTARDPDLCERPTFRDVPRHLKAIDEDVFRCKKIISALLDFSRSRPPQVRETDLNALAEAAVALVGYPMRLKQVEIALRTSADLPRIQADDGQLRQVIVGLLMNSLDAVGLHGHVVVETDRIAGGVRLTVSDDGPGIPVEDMDKIFTPFFTRKKTGSGMGLGLAVCHGIVSAHRGAIQVDSPERRGTRVSIVLPLPGAAGVA
jgi:two-component system, NtrC family, sensor kinase